MITRTVHNLRTDETGASMVEYGLMIVLIALAVLLTLTALGPTVAGMFSDPSLMDSL